MKDKLLLLGFIGFMALFFILIMISHYLTADRTLLNQDVVPYYQLEMGLMIAMFITMFIVTPALLYLILWGAKKEKIHSVIITLFFLIIISFVFILFMQSK